VQIRNYTAAYDWPRAYTITGTIPGTVSLSQTEAFMAGSDGTVSTVVTSYPPGWEATPEVDWLVAEGPTGQTGGTLTIRALANTRPERVGQVTVRAGSGSAVFTVYQREAGDDHGNSLTTATVWPITQQPQIAGVVNRGGDLDVFRFTAPMPGWYSFRSASDDPSGNPVGSLMDANGAVIVTDDDGAGGREFLLNAFLTPGVYYVQIRNYTAAYDWPRAYTITATIPGPVT
ncbi:MAG: BACON domain-containing protein, partial [Bifidobacteriaceae bacterium]|nr:BACON domain-containing protein [Bifidobacteriaceae bacterium]